MSKRQRVRMTRLCKTVVAIANAVGLFWTAGAVVAHVAGMVMGR